MTCAEHGPQPETFVCQHIVDTLRDKIARGFFWAADSDTERPDAWCADCERLVHAAGDWTPAVLEVAHVQLLCALCYDDAKALNINRT